MKRDAAHFTAPALATLLVLGLAASYPIDNADTFGHLAAGREIAALRHVPAFDTHAYFRSQPVAWVNYEWLSDTVYYALYALGGPALLYALTLSLVAALSAILVRTAQLRAAATGAWLVPLFVLAGLPGLRFRLSVRPHLFGLVCAALCLLGLMQLLTAQDRKQCLRWIGVLTLAHVAWVNLHGSHLLGLAFVGLAAISSARDRTRLLRLLALFGGMLLASCISPYGPRIAQGAIAHVFDPAYRTVIEEWRAWRMSQSLWYPAIWLAQLGWLASSFVLRRPNEPCRRFELLVAGLLGIMVARSLRFSAEFIALTVPAIAVGLAPWFERRSVVLKSAGGAGAACIAILGCLALPPRDQFGFGVETRGRPVASGVWLAEHLPNSRILATMSNAWDLMFMVPHAKFLLDGRAPLYGPEHIQRVQRAWGSPGLLRTLVDETHTDVVVIDPVIAEEQPALRALLGFPDFQLVMIEADHCVFARRTAAREALLRERGLRMLQPGYDPGWLVDDRLDHTRAAAELAQLPEHENVLPYRRWVRGMLALKPLLRSAGHAGLARPATASERATLTGALGDLRASDRALEFVQTVRVYHALAALAAGELAEARTAFERAKEFGPVREVLFGEQELALCQGDNSQVIAFVDAAERLPEALGDPWLLSLKAELATPHVCTSSLP